MVDQVVGQLVTPTGQLVLPAGATRDVWLEKRREGIGSSDLPAVMGLSGYSSPTHVYLDKRGDLPPEKDFSEPAWFGVLFEDPLAHDWARRNRTVVEPVGIVAFERDPWQMCSLDRLCTECPLDRSKKSLCALEVKCRNAFKATLWREGPPDDVLAQVLWQILVTGLDHIHVFCLIGGNDPRQYVVRRDDHSKLVALLDMEAARLWWDHIVPGIPPAVTGEEPPDAMIDLYERLHPEREGFVQLMREPEKIDPVSDYLAAVADASAAEKRRKQALATMYGNLGGAQLAMVGDRPLYSIGWSKRSKVDMELLRQKHPEAYRECVTQGGHDRIEIPDYVRKERTP